MVAEEDSVDENDWRCLRTLSTKQLAEGTSQLGPEENELQLRGMGGDLGQELDDEQALPIEEECDEGKRNSGKIADVMGDENEMTEAGEETSSDEPAQSQPLPCPLSYLSHARDAGDGMMATSVDQEQVWMIPKSP
ncbi:hypothetical protein HF521_022127 [Silurus meridionalis]|uniref:Uncharacterized protein n=1 Tax=Silurus meridionalis TaxID=175797 RepID=A0A8T0BD42_SILME|nr:hypothetical protein HF521_022127 [Silurus meridionalis]